MSFLTEIERNSSEKFCLIRLSAKRKRISVTSIGSNLFTATVNLNVVKCFYSLTEFTLVTGTPSSGEYSFNEDTKLLTVYSTLPLDDSLGLIVEHYLYLATDKNRAIGKDVSTPVLNLVEWMGRLKEAPTFTQTVSNLGAGILTLASSSIQIINLDGYYDFLFNDNDSVYNCKFDAWFFCNGISNYEHSFSGYLSSISQSDGILSINTIDPLSRLEKNCLCNDDLTEAFFDVDFYTARDPEKDMLPIPFCMGPTTSHKMLYKGVPSVWSVVSESLREAYCSSYTETIATNTNRTWTCFRCVDADALSVAVTFTSSGSDYACTVPILSDAQKFFVGDRVVLDGYSGFTVDSIASNVVNLVGPTSGPTSPCSLSFKEVPIVDIEYESTIYEISPDDYAISTVPLSSGNNIIELIFDNNFEAGYSGIGTLHPSTHVIRYRGRPSKVESSDALEIILKDAGIDYLFNNTVPTTYSCMEIPTLGDSSYQSGVSYVEKILQSNASFLYLDSNSKINYDDFAIDYVNYLDITEDDYISGSLNIKESMQDVKTKIVVIPLCAKMGGDNRIDWAYPEESSVIESVKEVTIESVLYPLSIPNNLINQNIRKLVSYSFTLKAKGYGLKIGSTVKIRGKWLVVVEIGKSISGLTIEAINTYTI